jgi:hypothetical protein
MPGFGADRIDAMQLEALLAHLQTIGTVAGGGTTETDVMAPTEGGDAAME